MGPAYDGVGGQVPPARTRAAALLAAEALAVALLAVLLGVSTARGEEAFPGAALGLAALTLVAALLLLGLARGVRHGRAWPRTPALVVQLVALPVGTDQVLNAQWTSGPAVLLLAGATAYHLLRQRPPA